MKRKARKYITQNTRAHSIRVKIPHKIPERVPNAEKYNKKYQYHRLFHTRKNTTQNTEMRSTNGKNTTNHFLFSFFKYL